MTRHGGASPRAARGPAAGAEPAGRGNDPALLAVPVDARPPGNPAVVGPAVDPDAVLAAYKKGTLLSFAVLEFAAILGIGVAVTTGSGTYGIILCLVSAFCMLTRWPRASELDRLIRGRATL